MSDIRHNSQEDDSFQEELEEVRILSLSQYEALYLSDSVTLLMEHSTDKDKIQIPARGLQSSASVPVPPGIINRIGLAVLLATSPNNASRISEMAVTVAELYLLRECCQSYVTHGNEPVGYNLTRKIYKLLLQKDLEEREIFDKLTADLDINLENTPRVERLGENSNADTTPNNDRRSD